MKSVDIVILSWAKNKELKNITISGINSLLKSENNIKFNIFLLESSKEVYDFPDNVKIVYMDSEFGYNKYMNYGRKLGNSNYVVLCNNDLRFEKKWASNIITEMENDKDLMSACSFEPIVNRKNYNGNFYGYVTRKHINGWCIFQRRKLYDIIGDLDETFNFWCCDDDYGMSLEKNNIKHKLVKSSIVYHDDNG